MKRAAWLQDRRMQKFSDVLSRWESGDLSMMEAGELLGMSERLFRRYRGGYDEAGLECLIDRRLGKSSPQARPWQGQGADAGALREQLSRLEREAFSRAPGAPSRLPLGLHLGEDAAACSGACGSRQAAWRSSAQTRAQALRRHDAAPGRLASRMARR